MTKDKASIAIVGAGWWATQSHIPVLKAHPQAEIIAICDLDSARLQKTSEVFEIPKTYTDLHAMLTHEEIDGVIVATNHASHYEVALQSITHGLPTLIEKPMTLYARDARALVRLAKERQVPLRIGYNHNYTRYARDCRQILRSGALGKVQYISGIFNQNIVGFLRGEPPPREGMIINPGDVYSDPVRSGGGFGHLQLTHLAGMIFYITGLKAERVFALMGRFGLRVDMVNAVNVEFEGGALASIGGTANLAGGGRKIDLQIYCEHGWIDIDEAEGKAMVHGESFDTTVFQLDGTFQERYPYSAPDDNLIDIILCNSNEGVDGEIGWRATELLEAAYQSAELAGSAVTIESLYPRES